MATIEKLVLSGSVNGRPILVAATSSPGTTIHTASSTATVYDEIWLYAMNNDSSNVALAVEFGSNSSSDLIAAEIPALSGLYLIVPGIPLQGNTQPPMVRAYAGTTNKISLLGWVNRIIQ